MLDFCQSRYGRCLTALGELKPELLLDIYLAEHVKTLYKKIREKCLLQVRHLPHGVPRPQPQTYRLTAGTSFCTCPMSQLALSLTCVPLSCVFCILAVLHSVPECGPAAHGLGVPGVGDGAGGGDGGAHHGQPAAGPHRQPEQDTAPPTGRQERRRIPQGTPAAFAHRTTCQARRAGWLVPWGSVGLCCGRTSQTSAGSSCYDLWV